MIVVAVEALTFGLGRLAAAARSRDCTLQLLTRDRSVYRYELDRLNDQDVVLVEVDTFDATAVREVLTSVSGLGGVINSTDTWTMIASRLAEDLGLPHQNPESLAVVRDKAKLRNRLYDARLSSGGAYDFVPAETTAEELAARLSFPAIIKDVAGTSSRNVWLARSPEQLTAILDVATHADLIGDRVTAEPYFTGPVLSLETLTWEGQTRLLGVTSRVMSSEPNFREEAASLPVALPEDQSAELAAWIARVLATVDYDRGFAHTEIVVTKDGYEVIEINPRLGGALVGESLCRALDTNIYTAYIDMALGRRPELMDRRPQVVRGVAQALLYASEPGVITAVEGLDALAQHPGEIEFLPVKTVGETISSVADQRGCVGILMATAPTSEVALLTALSAIGKLRVRTSAAEA